jgi:hypothetical protein
MEPRIVNLEELLELFKDIERIYGLYSYDIVVSTTLSPLCRRRRRNGTTTRQVDWIIQRLFEGKIVVCLDHHMYGTNRDANERLLRLVLFRLRMEHQCHENEIKFDKERFVIYLKQKNRNR